MLREKLAQELRNAVWFRPDIADLDDWLEAADCILAIPEIADALRACEDGGELDVYRANCEFPD